MLPVVGGAAVARYSEARARLGLQNFLADARHVCAPAGEWRRPAVAQKNRLLHANIT